MNRSYNKTNNRISISSVGYPHGEESKFRIYLIAKKDKEELKKFNGVIE